MAKKLNFDDQEGVWRTVGGRRIFIKNGQSLSEAMIESGKFKNLRSDYRKAKEEEKKKAIVPEALDKKALELYEKRDDAGWGDFTDEELKELAKQCQITKENPFGRAYDDEVFEEMDKRGLKLEQKIETSNVWEKQPDGTFLANKDAMKKQYEENHKNYDAKIKQFAEDRKNMTNGDWEGMLMAYEQQNADGTYKSLQDIMDDVDKYEKANDRKFKASMGEVDIPNNFEAQFNDYVKEQEKKEGFTQKSTSPFYPDRDYTQEELKKMEDAGIRPTKNSYSGSGWEGVNSNKNLSTKEQAKAITDAMKKKYPDVKISRKSELYSGGSSIHLDIMSSDKDLYVTDTDIDKMSLDDLAEVRRSNGFNWWAKDNVPGYKENKAMFTDKDVKTYAKTRLEEMKKGDNQSVRGDEWYLSDYGKKVVTDLNKEANSYTYDDSDAMTDYFDHGTYMWVNIGKWDKPYQVNQKATGETINNAIREKASGDPNKADVSYKTFLGKLTKGENEGKNYVEWKASQREKASKRVAEADIKEKGYEYYSRHGLGPGTLPKDVNTGGTGENENGWTKFKTDRPLTSEELKKYDIQSETRNSEIKSNNDRMNDILREKAYKKYLKEHPGSKISFEQFKDMRKQ